MSDAAWREVTDGLLSGVTHDLNDRISALSGIAHILRMDAGDDPMLELLAREVVRLDETVQLLRDYPRGRGGARAPAQVGDILPALARLERRHSGFDEVEVEVAESPGLPAAVFEWTAFARAVLLLLTAAAEEALRAGERIVRVTPLADGGSVAVRIAPAPEGAGIPEAAVAFAEAAGVGLEVTAEGEFELRLATLTA